MTAPALIIAAPRSGSGKTTVTLAVIAALRRRGIPVRAAKAGPDYIDTAFHAATTGKPCINLDSWAMPPALLDGLLGNATADAALVIIEGVMGLFDGLGGPLGRRGATADLAARFGLPVLLVIDVAGQSQTAAAVVRGLATHHVEVRIAGVVLNRVGSERHRSLVIDALKASDIPVFGAMPRDAALELPQRHLGLVQAREHDDLSGRLDRLADAAERYLDLDRIVAAGVTPVPAKHAAFAKAAQALAPPGQRIALACDAAFSFVYEHIVAGWRRAGAEVFPFSPLANEPPADACDACWLPGGYPELFAEKLAGAQHFHDGLRRFAATRPVHGECGGYMVLGEGIEDADGACHAMTGLLGHATSFAKRKLHLGYREARLRGDGLLGSQGAVIRGHEFHYATLSTPGRDDCLVDLFDGEGNSLGAAGGRRGRVSGAFFHVIATTQGCV